MAVFDVEEESAGGVGDFGDVVVGEAVADVVFGEEDLAALVEFFGLVFAEPEDLGGGEAGEGGVGDGISDEGRKWPPARCSISAHWAAVRWSFQRSAGRRTFPEALRKMEPCICPERPMARMAAGFILAFLMTAAVAFLAAVHQPSGFCSVQPGLGVSMTCGDSAVART